MNIMNLKDMTGYTGYEFGEKYQGADKEVAKIFGAQNLGFHLEVLNPGCFSCPYHYHEKEEELVIVLKGEAILRQNDSFKKIKEMDLIYFSTGSNFIHQIYNHTNSPFQYFVLSTKSEEDICHYPDSNKTMIRKNRLITQKDKEVDYWKDEEDPSIHWPENVLKGEI